MKTKRILQFLTVIVLAAAALHFGGRAVGPPPPPSKEERMKHFVACFRAEMNPTDEQINQLKDKILADDPEIMGVANALKEATFLLESKLETPGALESELLDLYAAVAKLRGRMSDDHFKRMLLLRSILTPEQQKRFLVCKRKMGPPALPHE